jgi:hypothetical protein
LPIFFDIKSEDILGLFELISTRLQQTCLKSFFIQLCVSTRDEIFPLNRARIRGRLTGGAGVQGLATILGRERVAPVEPLTKPLRLG